MRRGISLSLAFGAILGAAAPAAAAPCPFRPTCSGAAPQGSRASWRNFSTRLFTSFANKHRARDLFMRQGGAGVIVAKFAYGPMDKDLENEDVQVFVQKNCSQWFSGGTLRTSTGKTSVPALPPGTGQIKGAGGRVYFNIAPFNLPVGKHRIRFVVRGDGTGTDAFVEVLPAGARIAVTDLDGTQTSSEWALVGDLVGMRVAAHPSGPQTMQALAAKGYIPYYLSARAETFMKSTRSWLQTNGYPPGLVRISTTPLGVLGAQAVAYKVAELRGVAASAGVLPSVGFGNKASDVDAYKQAGMPMGNTYYYQLSGDLKGGHRFNHYDEALRAVSPMPSLCR